MGGTSSATTLLDDCFHQTLEGAISEEPWIDPNRFEAFEFQELVDVTKGLEHRFEDLAGVSPLWFGAENDDVGNGISFGEDRRERRTMFGDWVLGDSLIDVFENQANTSRSGKQEVLRVVDGLLATSDENGVKKRQGLEECAQAFKDVTEGDLPTKLDGLTKQAAQQWSDEQETVKAATNGLMDLEASTASRLEALALTLKDRQHTVLEEMKREREANKRKILASLPDDPHEESRLLFNKQLEEVELEGRLRQRQRLLDVDGGGTLLKQEEVEGAILRASRDRVQNLLQVVEKMQTQQTTLSVTLQAEKRKLAALRLQISTRLGISGKAASETVNAEPGHELASGTPVQGARLGDFVRHDSESTAKSHGTRECVGKDDPGGREDEALDGVELLDACDRLEHENIRLKHRLAQLQLQGLQKEHDEEEGSVHQDKGEAKLLQKKKQLKEKIESLKKIDAERMAELERLRAERAHGVDDVVDSTEVQDERKKLNQHKQDMDAEAAILRQKVTCLRRRMVFSLARKIMKKKFAEAGWAPGNLPDPPPGPVDAVELGAEAPECVPQDMRLQAALLRQKRAIERGIDTTEREEREVIEKLSSDGDGLSSHPEACVADTARVDEASGLPEVDGVEGDRGHSQGETKAQVDENLGGTGTEKSAAGDSDRISPWSGFLGRLGDGRRHLRQKARVLQQRLVVLRALAGKNEEALRCNPDVDEVDGALLQEVQELRCVPSSAFGVFVMRQVIRNEEILNQRVTEVLEILRSPEMEAARARSLKEALQRSLQPDAGGKEVAPSTSPDGVVISGVGSGQAARENSEDEESVTVRDSRDTRPARDVAVNDDATDVAMGDRGTVKCDSDGQVVLQPIAKGDLRQEGDSHFAAGEGSTAEKEQPALATKAVMPLASSDDRVEQHRVEAARAEKTEEQERERAACAELLKIRQQKQEIIKDLRAKIKAAGGGKPKTMSDELRRRELQRAVQAAQEAKDAQRAKEEEALMLGVKDPSLKDLPPKIKQEIANLRKQEAMLKARHELCVKRIRQLTQGKDGTPGSEQGKRGGSGRDDDQNSERPKARKLTRLELEKERYLHSLTPQLVRWRARIAAAVEVLEEAQAQRKAEELARQRTETGESGSEGRSTATEGERTSDKSRFPRVLPVLPLSRVNVDTASSMLPCEGSSEAGTNPSTGSGGRPGRVSSPTPRGRDAPRTLYDRQASRSTPNSRSLTGKRDWDAVVQELAAGNSKPDQARSVGRVFKEAQKLRERSEEGQRWVAQTARATEGKIDIRRAASPATPETSARPPSRPVSPLFRCFSPPARARFLRHWSTFAKNRTGVHDSQQRKLTGSLTPSIAEGDAKSTELHASEPAVMRRPHRSSPDEAGEDGPPQLSSFASLASAAPSRELHSGLAMAGEAGSRGNYRKELLSAPPAAAISPPFAHQGMAISAEAHGAFRARVSSSPPFHEQNVSKGTCEQRRTPPAQQSRSLICGAETTRPGDSDNDSSVLCSSIGQQDGKPSMLLWSPPPVQPGPPQTTRLVILGEQVVLPPSPRSPRSPRATRPTLPQERRAGNAGSRPNSRAERPAVDGETRNGVRARAALAPGKSALPDGSGSENAQKMSIEGTARSQARDHGGHEQHLPEVGTRTHGHCYSFGGMARRGQTARRTGPTTHGWTTITKRPGLAPFGVFSFGHEVAAAEERAPILSEFLHIVGPSLAAPRAGDGPRAPRPGPFRPGSLLGTTTHTSRRRPQAHGDHGYSIATGMLPTFASTTDNSSGRDRDLSVGSLQSHSTLGMTASAPFDQDTKASPSVEGNEATAGGQREGEPHTITMLASFRPTNRRGRPNIRGHVHFVSGMKVQRLPSKLRVRAATGGMFGRGIGRRAPAGTVSLTGPADKGAGVDVRVASARPAASNGTTTADRSVGLLTEIEGEDEKGRDSHGCARGPRDAAGLKGETPPRGTTISVDDVGGWPLQVLPARPLSRATSPLPRAWTPATNEGSVLAEANPEVETAMRDEFAVSRRG